MTNCKHLHIPIHLQRVHCCQYEFPANLHLLLHRKGETVVALFTPLSQDSCLRDVIGACEEFQRELLLFLQSRYPESQHLAQDLAIIQEEVDGVETEEERTRRVEAEGRVMVLVVQHSEMFGDGNWRESRKFLQAVLMRRNSVRAIDRLDFLLASSN